jgi:hypothetical protein
VLPACLEGRVRFDLDRFELLDGSVEAKPRNHGLGTLDSIGNAWRCTLFQCAGGGLLARLNRGNPSLERGVAGVIRALELDVDVR